MMTHRLVQMTGQHKGQHEFTEVVTMDCPNEVDGLSIALQRQVCTHCCMPSCAHPFCMCRNSSAACLSVTCVLQSLQAKQQRSNELKQRQQRGFDLQQQGSSELAQQLAAAQVQPPVWATGLMWEVVVMEHAAPGNAQ